MFRRVVLPLPVPPEMSTLTRAWTQADRKRTISGVMDFLATRSAASSGVVPNRRIDISEPSRASGGMMALTRLPSGSRASTMGLVSSTRRPTRAAIRWMIWSRWRSSLKAISARSSRPRRSTKTVLGPLIRMSEMVGSRSKGSRGPNPNVSSSTSLTSRSRSLMLSRSALWRHKASAARRTSMRSSSSFIVPMVERSMDAMSC